MRFARTSFLASIAAGCLAAPAYAQDPFFYAVHPDVPIVGFAAWERSFSANPDANYGRIVDHSYRAITSLDND